jgi:c-di-GMP-binding flagellar brake protein YcgR
MKKIFVKSDNIATLVCDGCGKRRRKDVSRFTRLKQEVRLKWTCPCGAVNRAVLERRNFVRFKVNLSGKFSYHSQDGQHSVAPLVVVDISQGGLLFKRRTGLGSYPFREGDRLSVQFDLDDQNRSSVQREVGVRTIREDGSVGAEFVSKEHYDRLGPYLLYHGA